MTSFVYRGPLAPDSPLFRDRTVELSQLIRMCQGEIRSYVTLYGGRQTGKTSLMLRFATLLPDSIRTCRIDFQGVPGATTSEAFHYLAQCIACRIPGLALSEVAVTDAPSLTGFVSHVASQPEVKLLLLLLEELGALPIATRENLANVLRHMFTSRYDWSSRSFARLLVVIAGGIELYELVATKVSTLHNICEPIYLGDLAESEAVGLIADGLEKLGKPRSIANALGQAVYDYAEGHPYLTQRFGAALETVLASGNELILAHVDETVELLLSGDPLLDHLRRSLVEEQLFEPVRDLLAGRVRFSRLDEEMARLELLGLAKEFDGYWVVRNRLLASALQQWLSIGARTAPQVADVRKERRMEDISRIFISSTWQDLQPEREAVEKALHRMRNTAFAGMEYFGSRPETPSEVSLAEVDRSDIYVGIFAHRYGSGITEEEYGRARERNLPCLIYFKDDDVPVIPSHVERDSERSAKLKMLKDELKANHTVSFFTSPDHLATQVVADLYNTLGSTPQVKGEEAFPRGSTYHVTITNSQGIAIGDQARVIQATEAHKPAHTAASALSKAPPWLVQVKGEHRVYVVERGMRHWIPDGPTLESTAAWEDIDLLANWEELASFPPGRPRPSVRQGVKPWLVQVRGEDEVYLIDEDRIRHRVLDQAALQSINRRTDVDVFVSWTELEQFQPGVPLYKIKPTPTG